MGKVKNDTQLLRAEIEGLCYQRDFAADIIKRSLTDTGWEHDAREFLSAIGKMTMNELPEEEREEYEKLRGDE